jgi:hypothetical protein
MTGVISYFDTRIPTAAELCDLTHIEVASSAVWDPMSAHFSYAEEWFCHAAMTLPSKAVTSIHAIIHPSAPLDL